MRKDIKKLLSVGLFCLSIGVWAQERPITGQVVDSDGFPVQDAYVYVDGSDKGVYTDADGYYSIDAETGDQISIEFIGFDTQTVAVGEQNTYDVQLSAGGTIGLKEVVATALGIEREKKALGYATQEVSGDDISSNPVSNFADALSGQVSGLDIKSSGTIGGSTNMVIRGMGSITGNNQALVVVDGTPINNGTGNTSNQRTGRGGYDYGNAASDINPNDVESINVLKGAAATALYGSRGANGVILITTKKGDKNSGRIGVEFNSSYTVGSADKETLPKYQNKYGAGGYTSSSRNRTDFYTQDIDGDGIEDNIVRWDDDASYGPEFDPNLMVYQWNSMYPGLAGYQQATPWVAAEHTPNDIWSSVSTFENSISFAGASEDASFRVGFTNFQQSGGLPNTSIKKNVLNFNGSYNLTEDLVASASVAYTNNMGKGRWGTGYDSRNPMQTFRQWWQTNVDLYEQRDAYEATGQNIVWDPKSGFDDTRPVYHDNFYWMRDNNYQTDDRNRYTGNASLNYEINDWLSVLGRFTFDNYNEIREERVAAGSVEPSGSAQYKGEYKLTKRTVGENNYDLIFSFSKDLTEHINLDANIGWNLRVNENNTFTGITNGGLKVPGLYALSNSVNALTSTDLYQYDARWMTDGEYARASLGFYDTYFLEGSYRTDRSSTLPEADNRFGYFSIAGSAVLSELIKKPWLKFWKVRGNYAEVGNAPGPYQVFNVYDLGSSYGTVASASNPSTSNNPFLKPERQKGWEIGTEVSLFKDRIYLDVSYYNNKTEDLLTTTNVSEASGVYAGYVNAGDVRNKGIEATLNLKPVKGENFSWDIGLNWAKNENKVEKLFGTNEFLTLADMQGGVSVGAYIGNPLGVIIGSDYVYDSNGNKIIGSNGYYLKHDNQILGDMNPDWKGGIKNTFRYKNVKLSFLIDIQKGGDVFSLDTWYGYATGLYDVTAGYNDLGNPIRDGVTTGSDSGGVILDGVTADVTYNSDGSYTVDETTIATNTTRVETNGYFYNPLGSYRAPNKAHVYDASYVKLRNVSISYDLPEKLLQGSFIKKFTISAIGRNLWIIHKNLPYSDPEAGLSAGNVQGYQSGAYPTFREIGASVKIQF